jgi:hypothetical protein
MSRFAHLNRPSFACQPAPAEKSPGGNIVRGMTRRAAMLQEASAVLTHLPAPGEALHALITGRYDLMHLLVCLLDRLGPARAVRIATLSFNARNLTEMFAILDGPDPPRLTLLCSAFFRDHNKELWRQTLEGFRKRGQAGASCRTAAARTHAKVITIESVSGSKLALEGSANLRSNGNREQFLLANDAGLHDWHAAWIDKLVTAHEGENDSDGKG